MKPAAREQLLLDRRDYRAALIERRNALDKKIDAVEEQIRELREDKKDQ
jgi:hypothetical protein